MPTKLKNHEFGKTRVKYPWEQWYGGEWECNPSKEFGVSADSFRSAIYKHCTRHGLSRVVEVDGDVVRFSICNRPH